MCRHSPPLPRADAAEAKTYGGSLPATMRSEGSNAAAGRSPALVRDWFWEGEFTRTLALPRLHSVPPRAGRDACPQGLQR